MRMRVYPSKIEGSISIPSSKSVLHRLIISACLCDDTTTIIATDYGKDIRATIDCMRCLGAKIIEVSGKIIITPIATPNQNVVLNVEESGSTLRFLLPIVASLGVTATFIGKEGIVNRPIKPIVDLLKKGGIAFSSDTLPLTISGKLKSGDYEIDGSISSQFITGLLFAFSITSGDSSLVVNHGLVSSSYVDITIDVLKTFGVDISKDNRYHIQGTKLVSPKVIETESDWSSACFMIALAVISGKVRIRSLNFDSKQWDKVILSLLAKMDAKFDCEGSDLVVNKSKLTSTSFTCRDCPDIVPIMSIILANSEGISSISGVDRLKIKESDRLSNVMDMLSRLGIKTRYDNDILYIYGGKMTPAKLVGYNDHRMTIAGIVALSLVGGEIDGVECTDKSYPTFLKDFERLGGRYELF